MKYRLGNSKASFAPNHFSPTHFIDDPDGSKAADIADAKEKD